MEGQNGAVAQDEIVPVPPAFGPLPQEQPNIDGNQQTDSDSESSSSHDPEDVAEYANFVADLDDDVNLNSSGSDIAIAGASGNLEPDDLTIQDHEPSDVDSSDDSNPDEPTSTVHVPDQSGSKFFL